MIVAFKCSAIGFSMELSTPARGPQTSLPAEKLPSELPSFGRQVKHRAHSQLNSAPALVAPARLGGIPGPL